MLKKQNLSSSFFALIVVILFASFPICSNAADNQNLSSQQDWITRQQQNSLEEKKRDAELNAIKKDRERKKKEEREDDGGSASVKVSGRTYTCFPIDEIHLLDADSLSKREQKKLVAPFLGKCFAPEILTNLATSVTAHYHSKGYITTQITIPKQNVESGEFELQIIEGKVEKILLNEDRVTDKMQKFTAFGNPVGKPLNAHDISQGIYQMNRLQSNAASMQIKPGNTVGESEVVVTNNKKIPAHFTVSKDNLGSNFTGVQRINFNSSFDNLLSLNDNIYANYTTNLRDDSREKDIKSFSSGISIPFKHNTFSYDFSHSEFRGQIPSSGSQIKYTGFSQQSKFGLDRLLLNVASLRLNANTSLTVKSTAGYQDNVKQNNSERKLSVINVGFSASSYLNNTTSLYLKPSYSKGLKILNAKQDSANTAKSTARAQFEVLKLYATFSKRFTLPKLGAPVTFSTEMDSQYAKNTLFGSEQFSVGGNYSVRGFRENYINGDSGYYFRNKFVVNLGSLIAPLLKQENKDISSQNFFRHNLVHLNTLSFEPFYDYGHIKNKFADNGADGRLSGYGLKTIFSSKFLNASLTYSKSANKSRLITSTIKEDRLVYFEISASCC